MSVSTAYKFFAVVGLASALTVLPQLASAQDVSESHFAAARAAVKASGSTSRFDLILPQVLQDVKTRFIANRPDLEGAITDIANDEAIALAPRRSDLEKEVAAVFAKVFTEAELVELEAFYLTDTGKKLLSETDVITRQIVVASRVWANGISRDLEANVAKVLTEKHGFKDSADDPTVVQPTEDKTSN